MLYVQNPQKVSLATSGELKLDIFHAENLRNPSVAAAK